MGSVAAYDIPTIDLSTFFLNKEDGEGKRQVTERLKRACSELGLCQIINHGIPLSLTNQAMQLNKEFFNLPSEEKLKFSSEPGTRYGLPQGYCKHRTGQNEVYVMYTPSTNSNVIPTYPPTLRDVMEQLFAKFTELCQLLEGVLNDSLGLPPNFLQDYNNDRSLDALFSYRYFQATETETKGSSSHQDPNVLGLILQDDIGGLEVLKDGEWIPVAPIDGALVFHICDVLQVLTNDKLVSPFHQVVRPKEKNRHSIVYFYNLNGEGWVEPLPQFTTEIGEPPKYKRFQYKGYCGARVREKFITPPARDQDKTRISNFASTCD